MILDFVNTKIDETHAGEQNYVNANLAHSFLIF